MRNGNLKPIKFNIAYVNVLIEMKCVYVCVCVDLGAAYYYDENVFN